MNVQIEDASIRLLDVLYEIELQCFKEEAFSKQQIGYLLSDYASISLVARVNGEIAGFIIGRIDLVRGQPVGHVMTIDVLPVYRKSGVAQRLMLALEDLLKQSDMRECHLEVRVGNVSALSLYLKLGYKRVRVLENYYGDSHGFYLKKNLS
ncbi:MAG: GNAT family N-acetyltransferase [Candidatus Bathyarchaeota archaeon]|nr:GNAT family N-acetyltransferase [Candidatus Bathyarchaeota archaeon]